MEKRYAIGVDVGGTNIRAGLVDEGGCLVAREEAETGEQRMGEDVVKKISGLVSSLRKKSDAPVVAVGCGVPGIVDFDSGIVHRSPNFPEWNEFPVREEISSSLKLPLALDNDANMHALGEALYGAGRGHRNVVVLTLGSGIGGGLILGGKVFHGDAGFAGEVGHMVFDPDGPPCNCGGHGCWELYAASRAFQTMAGRLAENERERLLTDAGVGILGLTPKVLSSLATKGNAAALGLWGSFGKALGAGIASLINVLGVDTFVIGGGIARSYDLFIDHARKSALSHTYAWHSERLLLLPAMLGDDAGIVGASCAAFRLQGGDTESGAPTPQNP